MGAQSLDFTTMKKNALEDFLDPVKKYEKDQEVQEFVTKMKEKKREWKRNWKNQIETRLEEWDEDKKNKEASKEREKKEMIEELVEANRNKIEETKEQMKELVNDQKTKEYEDKYLFDPSSQKKRVPLFKKLGQKYNRIKDKRINKRLADIREKHKPWDYDELRLHGDKIRNLMTEQKKERKDRLKQFQRDYHEHISKHKN